MFVGFKSAGEVSRQAMDVPMRHKKATVVVAAHTEATLEERCETVRFARVHSRRIDSIDEFCPPMAHPLRLRL